MTNQSGQTNPGQSGNQPVNPGQQQQDPGKQQTGQQPGQGAQMKSNAHKPHEPASASTTLPSAP